MKHPFFWRLTSYFLLLHNKILPPKTNMEPGNESQKESTLPGVHFRVPCWFLGEILNLWTWQNTTSSWPSSRMLCKDLVALGCILRVGIGGILGMRGQTCRRVIHLQPLDLKMIKTSKKTHCNGQIWNQNQFISSFATLPHFGSFQCHFPSHPPRCRKKSTSPTSRRIFKTSSDNLKGGPAVR